MQADQMVTERVAQEATKPRSYSRRRRNTAAVRRLESRWKANGVEDEVRQEGSQRA